METVSICLVINKTVILIFVFTLQTEGKRLLVGKSDSEQYVIVLQLQGCHVSLCFHSDTPPTHTHHMTCSATGSGERAALLAVNKKYTPLLLRWECGQGTSAVKFNPGR